MDASISVADTDIIAAFWGVPVPELQNTTNLQNWFGGRFWQKNEEGFVDSTPIPLSWDSGNQLMNRFLKTEASLI